MLYIKWEAGALLIPILSLNSGENLKSEEFLNVSCLTMNLCYKYIENTPYSLQFFLSYTVVTNSVIFDSREP